MLISELIVRLQQLQERVGDAPIEVRNPAGEFDSVWFIDATPHGLPGETKWSAHIDA